MTPSPPVQPMRPERVLVVGCGLSGEAVAARLARDGAAVTVSDRRPAGAIGAAADRLRGLGIELETGAHLPETFRDHDLIIVSPGVPLDIDVLGEARARGARIVSEIEFAFTHLQGTVAGITGTNGKSTATRLLGAILAAAGRRVTVCGNIGVPLTAALDADGPETVHCVELSSFQLEAIETFRPQVAILLNVRPDHQDRYSGFDEYAAAKARIFANQDRTDHAVVNASDPVGMAMRDRIRSRVHLVATGAAPADGAGIDGDWVTVRLDGAAERIVPRREIFLAGVHNLENVLACVLAARLLGAGREAIRSAVRDFRGLPHRLERIAEIDRITWWNDSKATNVDAVRRALEAFPGGVVLILGGRDKGGDFAPLRDPIRERARHLILMGEAAGTLRRQLDGLVPTASVANLDEAVAEARRRSGRGDAVLLSPGCASFDAYGNFQERGEHFRRLVDALRREARP